MAESLARMFRELRTRGLSEREAAAAVDMELARRLVARRLRKAGEWREPTPTEVERELARL